MKKIINLIPALILLPFLAMANEPEPMVFWDFTDVLMKTHPESFVKKLMEKDSLSRREAEVVSEFRGEYSIDWPEEGNETARKAIQNWIVDVFSTIQVEKKIPFPADFINVKELMEKRVDDVFKLSTPENLFIGEEVMIKATTYGDKFALLEARGNRWYYMGGRPPTAAAFAYFKLSDGKRLTKKMLPSIEKLRPLIIKEIKESHDILPLNEEVLDSIGWPSTEIAFNDKGLLLDYEEGDLPIPAPYFPVKVVIPFKELTPLLGSEAKSFIPPKPKD